MFNTQTKLRRKLLHFLVLICVFCTSGVLPYTKTDHIYASSNYEEFKPNTFEEVTYLNSDIIGKIGVEDAKRLAEKVMPNQYYFHDGGFERVNGERYYIINVKWKVDDRYSHIGYVFISFDGKVGLEGDRIGNKVLVYSNTNYLADVSEVVEKEHSFQLLDIGKTWEEAKKICEDMGGHLATITTLSEQDELEQLLREGHRNCYWLGGYRGSDGWKWVNDENFDFTKWATDEPNNLKTFSDAGEDSLMVYRNQNPNATATSWFGAWNDLYHDGTDEGFFGLDNFGFICEWDGKKENSSNSHKVQFNSHGGSNVEDQVVKSGEKILKPQDPKKKGYAFGGWYEDEDYTILYDFNFRLLSDITLHAKWRRVGVSDYVEKVEKWIYNKGTYNDVLWLCNESNFPNSIAVKGYDESFTSDVVSAMTNLVYRGVKGWSQIISKEVSKQKAKELLASMFYEYHIKCEKLSENETAKEISDIIKIAYDEYVDIYLKNNKTTKEEVEDIVDTFKKGDLSKEFLDGTYDNFVNKIGSSKKSNVI